jgi:hypothetical protein
MKNISLGVIIIYAHTKGTMPNNIHISCFNGRLLTLACNANVSWASNLDRLHSLVFVCFLTVTARKILLIVRKAIISLSSEKYENENYI